MRQAAVDRMPPIKIGIVIDPATDGRKNPSTAEPKVILDTSEK